MAKDEDNISEGDDLFTECENLSTGIRDMTKGFFHKEIIKKAIWKANEREMG